MNPITPATRLQRQQRLLQQQAADTVVLLTLDEGRYYALAESAGRAWELCDGLRTVAQIAARLADEYEAAPDRIVLDLVALFSELAHENLVCQSP